MRGSFLVTLLFGATVALAEEPADATTSRAFELTVYPVAVQVNGKWTQHAGTFGGAWWHVRDDVAVQVSGGVNWLNAPSSFSDELIDKVLAEAQTTKQVLLTWSVLAGVEVTPVTGHLALVGGSPVRLSIGLGSGVGLGGSRHQLRPEFTRADGTTSEATWGDTGLRPVYAVGADARIEWGAHFALRLELKDVLYSTFFDRVNGCSYDDVRQRAGWDWENYSPSPSCNLAAFGRPPDSWNNGYQAANLLRHPTAEVLHNVTAAMGVSVLF